VQLLQRFPDLNVLVAMAGNMLPEDLHSGGLLTTAEGHRGDQLLGVPPWSVAALLRFTRIFAFPQVTRVQVRTAGTPGCADSDAMSCVSGARQDGFRRFTSYVGIAALIFRTRSTGRSGQCGDRRPQRPALRGGDSVPRRAGDDLCGDTDGERPGWPMGMRFCHKHQC